ncbi:peptidyl-prolyl cis-trans isomerase B (cyclophilin B) [Gracilibacillus ureilyticus]|uniref:Peptidyl-prolyl cis-trans isomerase n=1 Tax=Gracilibacillus ureilyticus TaxID=531814 RepID=A0A1H9NFW3_9BACI|nr:peptidylprolyl isomerase [Gracilibacillus ureilyticus]SER34840.1 peptidyl-prolyl cis-trans isomerase B (cyclophilin B) [Gracilibacillus ureilyticus]
MRKLLYFLFILFVVILLSACGQGQQSSSGNDMEEQVEIQKGEKPVVTMKMENGEEIVMELYPEFAPETVENFIQLVSEGFYDGLIFHRVIPGFMIQGGDPEGNGLGGSDNTITGEFESNGFENPLLHKEGVISMARSQDPDSASSQFFIMVEDSPHLDGDYAAFGQVISGMDTVHEIANVKRDRNDKPEKDQVISEMTVNLPE